MSNDELGPKSIEAFTHLQVLESEMRLTKTLSELSFDQLQISDLNKCKLLQVIKKFQNLRKVKISGMNLSDKKVFIDLHELIKECNQLSSLSTLDLSGTNLKSDQIVLVTGEISFNKYLQNLNLSMNFVSDKERQVLVAEDPLVKKRSNKKPVFVT